MFKRIKKVLPTVYDESLSYYEVLNKLTKRINEVAEEMEVILPDIHDIEHLLESKQDTLVSGENIKTVNHNSLLGAGNLEVQEKLVNGTNIKSINSDSLLGSGNINLQEPLVSGVNLKTINSQSLLGSGNIDVGGGSGTSDYNDLSNKPKVNNVTLTGNKSSSDLGLQEELTSGINIKTINNQNILGAGNISIAGANGIYPCNLYTTEQEIIDALNNQLLPVFCFAWTEGVSGQPLDLYVFGGKSNLVSGTKYWFINTKVYGYDGTEDKVQSFMSSVYVFDPDYSVAPDIHWYDAGYIIDKPLPAYKSVQYYRHNLTLTKSGVVVHCATIDNSDTPIDASNAFVRLAIRGTTPASGSYFHSDTYYPIDAVAGDTQSTLSILYTDMEDGTEDDIVVNLTDLTFHDDVTLMNTTIYF